MIVEEPAQYSPRAKPVEICRESLARLHYRMQLGRFITRWEASGPLISVFSHLSASPVWNHAAWLAEPDEAMISAAAQIKRGPRAAERCPALFFFSGPKYHAWLSQLEDLGYASFDCESWMLWKPSALPESRLRVVRAAHAEQMADFIQIFNAAYQMPNGRFGAALEAQLRDPVAGQGAHHWIGYVGTEAVSVASLMELDGAGCIYNVGTSPAALGRGFATELMSDVLRFAEGRGLRNVFLQAESGAGAERVYQRLGFQTVFSRRGVRLKEWTARRSFTPKTAGSESAAEAADTSSEHGEARLGLRQPAPVLSSTGLIEKLEEASSETGIHPRVYCAAACASLLSRYSYEEQVCLGVRVPDTSGHLCAPLPLSVNVPIDGSVRLWLDEVAAQYRAGVTLQALRDGGHEPQLSDASFDGIAAFPVAEGHFENAGEASTAIDAVFHASGGAAISIRSPQDHPDAARIGDRLVTLLTQFSGNASQLLTETTVLSEEEAEIAIQASAKPLPAGIEARPVHQSFEGRAASHPDAPALVWQAQEDGPLETWTYAELNHRAGVIARRLADLGVMPGAFVAVCCERSPFMIAAALGIFKAGAVCVPLDPGYPASRLNFIAQDSGASVFIADSRDFRAGKAGSVTVAALEDMDWNAGQASRVAVEPCLGAYVIYTSGSTGTPKGAMVSHRTFALHCAIMAERYGLSEKDRVLQFASLGFDTAFEQIFPTLISGASLFIKGRQTWTPPQFSKILETARLTVADLPTAYLHQLCQEWLQHPRLKAPADLRLAIAGGEAMMAETARLWRRTHLQAVRLLNAYGPTEATITSSVHEVGGNSEIHGQRVPIGQALPGRSLLILDRFQQVAPAGAAGELWIGGPLLAEGYLNRPELNAAKFLPDPFSKEPGARLYRTGDLARILAHGDLEFLGRTDDQVKIRGFRIELGEVESALQEHPAILQAAAGVQEFAPGDKRLVAWAVWRDEKRPSDKELAEFLKTRVPEYMAPSSYVTLDALPLTPHGKVDRRALAVADAVPAEAETVARKGPSSPMELRLQLAFQTVLRRSVGVDESFFDLGGNSLQALNLLIQAEHIAGRRIPLEALYENPTPEGLARSIQASGQTPEWSCLAPLRARGSRPPLFLIHTTPGDILGYGTLIYHLSQDQPCYGVQAVGLGPEGEPHTRIEQMAECYADHLQKAQPEGPFCLAGWCYGGILAVEIARLLEERGRKVAFLGLLETVAAAPSLRVYSYYFHRLKCVLRMGPSRWRAYVRGKVKYRRWLKELPEIRFQLDHGVAPAEAATGEADQRTLARLRRVYEANLVALRHYESRPYPGKVTLFNAEEQDAALIPDPKYGWVGLADEIEIHSAPGNHDTMLNEPNVAVLVKK
ncbi:MAG: amino acid adenylation domain-containing protein, partial [Verrucomicrobia bacterium]|nr:amino acid adenylation domain-containing protein [Verrucomicrobiota bacterium]